MAVPPAKQFGNKLMDSYNVISLLRPAGPETKTAVVDLPTHRMVWNLLPEIKTAEEISAILKAIKLGGMGSCERLMREFAKKSMVVLAEVSRGEKDIVSIGGFVACLKTFDEETRRYGLTKEVKEATLELIKELELDMAFSQFLNVNERKGAMRVIMAWMKEN